MNSTSQLNWTKVSYPDITGAISVISSGSIPNIQKFSSNFTSIFPTEDGGYSVVTAQYNTSVNTSGITEYYPPWTAVVNFIPPGTGNQTSGPFQIFQQTNQILVSLNIFQCTISFASFGYNCIMYQIPLNASKSFLNIEFLRSGAVIGTNPIDFVVNSSTVVWDTETLFEGGYLIMTESNNKVDGEVFANNGSFYSDWGMPTNYNYTQHVGVFPNNTIWAIALGNDNHTWTYISNYNFSNYRNAPDPGGYDNVFVNSTTPPRLAKISGETTTKLTINFTRMVDLTNGGNISIWQLNSSSPLTYSTSTTISSMYSLKSLNSVDTLLGFLSNSSSSNSSIMSSYLTYATSSPVSSILRQTFSGLNSQFVSITNNNTTVEFDALKSTFNQDGAIYFVIMDNGFVEDSALVQPLLGLRPLAWNFSTDFSDLDTGPGSLDAIIRLTPEGTSYYTSLSTENQTTFVDQLSTEMSSIVPCSSTRLRVSRHYQFDTGVAVSQILMKVGISSPSTDSTLTTLVGIPRELSSSKVRQDLDTLIRNRDVTPISQKPFTSFLDPKFGCQAMPNLWRRYRWILFGVCFGLLILFIVFLISRMKYKEGRSFVIFTFALIAVDFVLDILFVAFNGHDLSWLFDVSIAFLIIPIGLNFIFTFLIITNETAENYGFGRWWFRNPKVALIFTILSGADIESLNVVSSRCAKVQGLSAQFSARGLKYLIIFNLFSLVIEDLPQLIILILYQVYTVLPAIVPILALASCSIVIPLKITSMIYLWFLCVDRDSTSSKLPEKLPEEVRTEAGHGSRDSSNRDEYDSGHEGISQFPIGDQIDRPPVKTVTPPKTVEGSIVRVGTPTRLGGEVFPEIETTSSTSATGGSSVTPYKSKMIEQIDVPEEQTTPPPPKKSMSFRLFGSKKDPSGSDKGKLRVTIPESQEVDTGDDDGSDRGGDSNGEDGSEENNDE